MIKSNVEKLLLRKTYADIGLRNIGATQLPLLKSRSSYWTIEVNVEKQTPFLKLMNIKDEKEHNGTYCFVKELLLTSSTQKCQQWINHYLRLALSKLISLTMNYFKKQRESYSDSL